MGAVFALIAGCGGLATRSIIALAAIGAIGLSLAALEHGWFKAPLCIDGPLRVVKPSIVLLFIWGMWSATAIIMLYGEKDAERREAARNIRLDISLPEGFRNNPTMSSFTVENASQQTLTDKHRLVCRINRLIIGGQSVVNGSGKINQDGAIGIMAFSKNETNKAWMLFWYKDDDPKNLPKPNEQSSPILPDGDANSESCLSLYATMQPFQCADVTAIFQYSLETQPGIVMYKEARWRTQNTGDGGFVWYREPIRRSGDYCTTQQ